MRTPAEYEADFDRLALAMDLEVNARMSMAEAFARATDDLKAAEEKLTASAERIRCLVGYLEAWDGPKFPPTELPDVIAEANALLDDPKARGEQALPLEV